ncbi:zinc finger protein 704 isoform X2 [Syngnathus typhle]|uniref:zinc finger protein 704 isoform X2 n=1 Tax=Syngnathus typhle TaxID=161592 RepID=UPI002A6AD564|nr:zinc finger protein 704 isoform X2 [Syngnathus typhle]
MDSRSILDKPVVGTRLAGADFGYRTTRSVLHDSRLEKSGGLRAGATANGTVLFKCVRGGQATKDNVFAEGNGRRLHDGEKTGLGEHRDTGCTASLKRTSPTHCPVTNGQTPSSFMSLDITTQERQVEMAISFRPTPGQNVPEKERQPLPSSHIPVPRNRKPSGHADKEVMAAAVLTSLSTSPLVLCPSSTPTAPFCCACHCHGNLTRWSKSWQLSQPPSPFCTTYRGSLLRMSQHGAAVPEPAIRAWKEALSASYSSSTSGNWSWDASDQSVPSTPSPPLSNDANKNFLLPSQGDDVSEDVAESTHFMFEDPIPRKRKNSMKVMFKCLWKNCEKVLSTSSGIQRHIRTVHLGRNSDSDYSDGEEDFYYSEIEVNMDSLTEGMSSLTPTSPTTAGPPPIFPSPLADVPHSEHINLNGVHSHAPTLLSQSAPSTLCHIRTDHAYQGPAVTHVRTVSIGEKRQPASGTNGTVNKNHALIMPMPKSAQGNRKPRGEAKKCRKVYGMEKKEMWCTACRWKKACQRFTD